ncbi:MULTISPECIES: hypothetical protein [Prescottella]|uniref:hypothetical protein n=1 Tax=Prescottella TaxID=2979332 RepID=UPI0007CD8141|nr:hypothetical protein [Prescottella equi]GBF16142.1 hypothetical protein Br6_03535 [Rhodococcus sp. Br-6]MBM4477461.1 hypothetical protein [Prescottella equi]MBM4486100.1 hypothetical protein [Prescottella equi]MBM4520778.1 hypothetical protein [Prescottella equi]MBM4532208.1 hypothetical protein [Prescottella equi]
MASTKKKVGIGVGAVLALAVFGSCVNDDDRAPIQAAPSTSATTTKSVPVADRTEWVGTVVGYSSYDTDLIVDVDGKSQTVGFANVGQVHCGGAYAANSQAQKDRIAQLAPIGSAVRIARTTGYGGRLSSDGFVYVETRTAASTTTTTTTSAGTTTSASATFTQQPAGAVTTSEIAGSGTTVNAALMSEGMAAIDPAIDLSTVALAPSDQAIANATAANAVGAGAMHFPGMLDAYRAAWDNRVGLQALCRADDDAAIRKAEQRKELDRLKAGPDGVLYTSDDDKTLYRYDDAGNLYVDTPSYSTGGGGGWGGGESRFCSRRWWC